MSQNNSSNQWPKACVAIAGAAAIAFATYITNEPDCLWSMILLYFIVENFD